MAKNHDIRFRVSKDELERIRKNADSIGLKVGAYCRLSSLQITIKIKGDQGDE